MAGQQALVVEDNYEIARLMKLILHELGVSAVVARDGEEAIHALHESPPDMVLLDLNIPKISGVEVLRRIRSDERLAQIKVIVISANPHMVDESVDMADLVLQKPVSYSQVRDLVQRMI
ncbi:MAG: response regulator [Chloroflexi bacterium]|nr:MAG: response regulator [Chloroflexota bacterium]